MKISETGQALLILLLSTLVALTIGLAITQRTLSDVSTSTRVEQSSRAFSAAEAGIEKAFDPTGGLPFSTSNYVGTTELGNEASADVSSSGPIPVVGVEGDPQPGLEYPPIDKTDFAQFWLINLNTITTWLNTNPIGALSPTYSPTSAMLYFGNPGTAPADKPAVEARLIYFQYPNGNPANGQIRSLPYYKDSLSRSGNGFDFNATNCPASSTVTRQTYSLNSVNSLTPQNSSFLCGYNLAFPTAAGQTIVPIMIRVRVIYSNVPQKVAIAPDPTCISISGNCNMPTQAVIYTSKGKSGPTQRQIQLFTVRNAVPFYFDFSIFSAGDITK